MKINFYLIYTVGNIYSNFIPPLIASADDPFANKDVIETCLKTGDKEVCEVAIGLVEDLQRSAAFEANYSCQTHALGLTADLIMSEFKQDRRESGYMMIDKISTICY